MKTNSKKVEDNFYGKRVVKGIFAKAKFATNDLALANFLRKYKENEDRNYHSENILLLAKFVGSSDEVTQASMFVDLVKRMRGLPPEVKDEQYALYKRLAAKAKAKYPSTDFARTGFKARFAKEYVMWGLPKGSTNRLDEKVMAEGLYTPAQVDDVKRRASAAGWHSFRVVAMMSFDDMTNAFKGKGIKRRSSRTGSKAKFANGVYGNEEIAKGLSQVLKILGFDAMASGILTGPKDNETLRKYIRALKSKMSPMSSNERGMVLLQILEKQLASRTGAKAKFSHLSTMLDMLDYQSANDQEDLARKNIKGLAQSIGKLNPTKDEWSRYVKIAKSLGFSESQISGFARIGAKVFK